MHIARIASALSVALPLFARAAEATGRGLVRIERRRANPARHGVTTRRSRSPSTERRTPTRSGESRRSTSSSPRRRDAARPPHGSVKATPRHCARARRQSPTNRARIPYGTSPFVPEPAHRRVGLRSPIPPQSRIEQSHEASTQQALPVLGGKSEMRRGLVGLRPKRLRGLRRLRVVVGKLVLCAHLESFQRGPLQRFLVLPVQIHPIRPRRSRMGLQASLDVRASVPSSDMVVRAQSGGSHGGSMTSELEGAFEDAPGPQVRSR
jgi:hypothetical protein